MVYKNNNFTIIIFKAQTHVFNNNFDFKNFLIKLYFIKQCIFWTTTVHLFIRCIFLEDSSREKILYQLSFVKAFKRAKRLQHFQKKIKFFKRYKHFINAQTNLKYNLHGNFKFKSFFKFKRKSRIKLYKLNNKSFSDLNNKFFKETPIRTKDFLVKNYFFNANMYAKTTLNSTNTSTKIHLSKRVKNKYSITKKTLQTVILETLATQKKNPKLNNAGNLPMPYKTKFLITNFFKKNTDINKIVLYDSTLNLQIEITVPTKITVLCICDIHYIFIFCVVFTNTNYNFYIKFYTLAITICDFKVEYELLNFINECQNIKTGLDFKKTAEITACKNVTVVKSENLMTWDAITILKAAATEKIIVSRTCISGTTFLSKQVFFNWLNNFNNFKKFTYLANAAYNTVAVSDFIELSTNHFEFKRLTFQNFSQMLEQINNPFKKHPIFKEFWGMGAYFRSFLKYRVATLNWSTNTELLKAVILGDSLNQEFSNIVFINTKVLLKNNLYQELLFFKKLITDDFLNNGTIAISDNVSNVNTFDTLLIDYNYKLALNAQSLQNKLTGVIAKDYEFRFELKKEKKSNSDFSANIQNAAELLNF